MFITSSDIKDIFVEVGTFLRHLLVVGVAYMFKTWATTENLSPCHIIYMYGI